MVGRADGGHGVVGVGDSFMNGYGLPVGGVACRSWGAWLAWARTTCFTQIAVDGATVEQVLRDQTPLLDRHFELGVFWAGTNDFRGFDGDRFHERITGICEHLMQHCSLVALATLPARFTAPRASLVVHEASRKAANAAIRAVVAKHGVVLVELEHELDGAWSVAGRHEHPTALGQLAAAHVAAAALDATGFAFRRHLPPIDRLAPTPEEQRSYWPSPGLVRRARAAGRHP